MRATDSITFSNLSANSPVFSLSGGVYCATVLATWGGGSVVLAAVAQDGSLTSVTIGTWTVNASRGQTWLPAGQYRWVVTTATGVYANLCRVPVEG